MERCAVLYKSELLWPTVGVSNNAGSFSARLHCLYCKLHRELQPRGLLVLCTELLEEDSVCQSRDMDGKYCRFVELLFSCPCDRCLNRNITCCACVFELRRNRINIETSLLSVDHGRIVSRSNVLLFCLSFWCVIGPIYFI